MTVKMPVSLWDSLPEDQAYVLISFVGTKVVIPEAEVEAEEMVVAYESVW